jgi:hypothetical protein
MIKITSLSVAGALLAFGLSAAQAQVCHEVNRTFVSGKGTDANAGDCCVFTHPCQTFAVAIARTAAGGEIDVLDPADYGTVTITRAISIFNDGVGVAGIQTEPDTNGVTINAGASDSVHLRGLTIEGLGVGTNGIRFNTGGNLAIENCVVRNFTLAGIAITPSTSSNFSVSNTIASDNPNEGIAINPQGAAVVQGVLSKVTANNNNSAGIVVDGSFTTGASLNVTVVDSEAANNGGAGVAAVSLPRQAAAAVMVRNVIANNNKNSGLAVQGNAILRVAHSVVTGNNTGLVTDRGGAIFSYGDNDIDGNANDNTGVLTSLAMH